MLYSVYEFMWLFREKDFQKMQFLFAIKKAINKYYNKELWEKSCIPEAGSNWRDNVFVYKGLWTEYTPHLIVHMNAVWSLLTFKLRSLSLSRHLSAHSSCPTSQPSSAAILLHQIQLLPAAPAGWASSQLGNKTRKLPSSSGTAEKLPLPDWFWSFFLPVLSFSHLAMVSAIQRQSAWKVKKGGHTPLSVQGRLGFEWVKQKQYLSTMVAIFWG